MLRALARSAQLGTFERANVMAPQGTRPEPPLQPRVEERGGNPHPTPFGPSPCGGNTGIPHDAEDWREDGLRARLEVWIWPA